MTHLWQVEVFESRVLKVKLRDKSVFYIFILLRFSSSNLLVSPAHHGTSYPRSPLWNESVSYPRCLFFVCLQLKCWPTRKVMLRYRFPHKILFIQSFSDIGLRSEGQELSNTPGGQKASVTWSQLQEDGKLPHNSSRDCCLSPVLVIPGDMWEVRVNLKCVYIFLSLNGNNILHR